MKRKRAASEQAREHTNEESRSKSSRLDASIVGKALDNGDASDEEEYGGENGAFLENGDTGDSFEHQYSDALADIMDPLVSRAQEGKADTDVSISETFGTLARRHFGRSVSSVFRVKKKIAAAWAAKHSKHKGRKPFPVDGEPEGLLLTPLQTELFPWIESYQDLVISDRQESWTDDLRELLALHALNHVLKTRDRIISNNSKLNVAATNGKSSELEFRDQSFVRPKVLVLLPFRSSAHAFVRNLIAFSGTTQQENKSRFEDEYGDGGEAKRFDPSKPDEFKRIFAGNSDDNFRLGLKITRKAIKLFSDFFSSDIIVASPLGLRTVGEKSKSKDELGDVLSSIEIVILDQCDVFLMQNWEHVQYIFSKMNGIPKDSHGCDFSRVTRWCLDGKSRFLRQTVIFSSIASPDINALLKKSCHNISGIIKATKTYTGIERNAVGMVSQIFRRFECSRPSEEADLRLNFFVDTIFPSLRVVSGAGLLIFVSSYFEFVRLRNHFVKTQQNFTSLSEYTEQADVNRNRARFASGDHPILLVTERAHFFRRYRIKGVKKILFYSLPDYPGFYLDMLRLASPQDGGDCTSMFCRLDRLKLERIVGSARSADWEGQQKNTFT